MKNEYGRTECYSSFYNRMKEKNCTYSTYEEVLKANKIGLWKEHPMKVIRQNNTIITAPLRFDLNKDGWKEVIKNKSFTGVNITRRLGTKNISDPRAVEILFTANEDGVFKVGKKQLRDIRQKGRVQTSSDPGESQAISDD